MSATGDLFDDLRARVVAIPSRPQLQKRSSEPPVEPALVDPATVDPTQLRKVGRCRQCGQVQWSLHDQPCDICGPCAALQVIRDPRPSYPDDVLRSARNFARYNSAQEIVWQLAVEIKDALRFRRRLLNDYDARSDFSNSYNLACSEMHKRAKGAAE